MAVVVVGELSWLNPIGIGFYEGAGHEGPLCGAPETRTESSPSGRMLGIKWGLIYVLPWSASEKCCAEGVVLAA